MNPPIDAPDVPAPWAPGGARRVAAALAMLLVLVFSAAAIASMPDTAASGPVSTEQRPAG